MPQILKKARRADAVRKVGGTLRERCPVFAFAGQSIRAWIAFILTLLWLHLADGAFFTGRRGPSQEATRLAAAGLSEQAGLLALRGAGAAVVRLLVLVVAHDALDLKCEPRPKRACRVAPLLRCITSLALCVKPHALAVDRHIYRPRARCPKLKVDDSHRRGVCRALARDWHGGVALAATAVLIRVPDAFGTKRLEDGSFVGLELVALARLLILLAHEYFHPGACHGRHSAVGHRVAARPDHRRVVLRNVIEAAHAGVVRAAGVDLQRVIRGAKFFLYAVLVRVRVRNLEEHLQAAVAAVVARDRHRIVPQVAELHGEGVVF
mmetsp:Transcript_13813/g.43343  ORF Transcript_13813/g.43343 Transcript_13813/m.43343 type:complete len:322 (-) Transcript_13813:502-1467(-)